MLPFCINTLMATMPSSLMAAKWRGVSSEVDPLMLHRSGQASRHHAKDSKCHQVAKWITEASKIQEHLWMSFLESGISHLISDFNRSSMFKPLHIAKLIMNLTFLMSRLITTAWSKLISAFIFSDISFQHLQRKL